jgi:hypothetical protein
MRCAHHTDSAFVPGRIVKTWEDRRNRSSAASRPTKRPAKSSKDLVQPAAVYYRRWSSSQKICIRGIIQNIPDPFRHLYSSCGSAKQLTQQAKIWIPGSTRSLVASEWKRAKTLPRTLARINLPASPWQRTVLHFRPHLAASGKIKIGCHSPPTVQA